MAERPPPGYNKRDKPLPHDFFYKYNLSIQTGTNRMMETYMHTSKLTAAPSTIEVNPRNAAFANETGALVGFDSIIQIIDIITDISLTKQAVVTDKFHAIKFFWQNIHGAFEDAWTPTDEKTGFSTATILELISDTTNEDVIPDFLTDLLTEQDQPLSTIHDTETFAHYGLTTDAKLEGVPWDLDLWFDAMQFFTNAGKLKTLAGRVNSATVTTNKPYMRIRERRFVPKSVRFGNPHMFFGRRYYAPVPTDKYSIQSDADSSAGLGTLNVTTKIRYNEWNPDFNQSRM